MQEKLPTTPKSDSIAALATPTGRGGVGIIRLSGHNLAALAEDLAGACSAPRVATLCDFRAQDHSLIDQGLLLYFPAPHSFTGEDVLELHGHGGQIVLHMLLSRCLELGARLAEPGEFTRRAYLNGKLDLAQAEAVADLIDAASTAAAKSAVRSLQGAFSKEIHALLAELTELRALVEATLDFPEEEIDFLEASNAFGRLNLLQQQLQRVQQRAVQGQLLQNGLHVVLVGQANVGKSSLLNQLTGNELAIVTPVAGTTRDAIRGSFAIEGVPLHVIDTAGLRDTDDEVEKIGIERTWQEIERADLVLLLVDAREGVQDADRRILARLPAQLKRLTIFNKIDLTQQAAARHESADGVCLSLSAKQGDGVQLLRQELLKIAGWQPAEDVFIARQRHLNALGDAQKHIERAQGQLSQLELFAEELRLAQNALGLITGEFSADDLLGEIFGRFCIGK